MAAWLEVSRRHAADYELAPKDTPDAKLKMLPKAVFRHSQPVRGDDIGAVYLWVDDSGVPAALGTVFAFSYGEPGERWVAHEFHSLTTPPLTGKWRGDSAWLIVLWALAEYRTWAYRFASPLLLPAARQAFVLLSRYRGALSCSLNLTPDVQQGRDLHA